MVDLKKYNNIALYGIFIAEYSHFTK